MDPISQFLAFKVELRTQAELLSIQHRVVAVLCRVGPDEEKSRLQQLIRRKTKQNEETGKRTESESENSMRIDLEVLKRTDREKQVEK